MLRPTTIMGSLYNMNPPSSLGTPVLRYFYLMAQKSCLFWGRSSWQKCQFVCQYGDLRWPQATLHFRSVKLIYCFPLSFCDDNTFYRYFSPFHPFMDPLHSTGGGEFGVKRWYWLVYHRHRFMLQWPLLWLLVSELFGLIRGYGHLDICLLVTGIFLPGFIHPSWTKCLEFWVPVVATGHRHHRLPWQPIGSVRD